MGTLCKCFTYYGSKFTIAPAYPKPRFGTIVEPFAGSAGYSCRYPEADVRLYDADVKVFGVWDFLIKSSPADIRALPVGFKHLDECSGLSQEAQWFIGWNLNSPSARPVRQPSGHMRAVAARDSGTYWGPTMREVVAQQVSRIKHWSIKLASWEAVSPDKDVTYFVDPPYQASVGRAYDTNLDAADFPRLGRWCRSLLGQVIVCEQEGADWLDFKPLGQFQAGAYAKAAGRVLKEVIWTNV